MDQEPVEEEKILFSINPQKLLNRKLLFTTQDWIDDLKMESALEGKDIPPYRIQSYYRYMVFTF